VDGSSYSRVAIGSLPPAVEQALIDAAAPMVAQPRTNWGGRLTHPLCVGLAAAAHLALAALFLPIRTDALGDGGTALEAIAVDMVDSLPSDAAPQIAASQSNTAEAVEEVAEAAPAPATKAPPPEMAVEIAIPPPHGALTGPETPAETQEHKPQHMPQPPPAPSQLASVGSIATAEASPGVVHAYGARIARIISQGRPRGRDLSGFKGKVVLAFAVDASGRIERVEVQRSSGNPDLDSRAVGALQKLSFPAPAPEMSERQRFFTVPFEFR
jgi:periplasmic protein TonB